MLLIDPGTNLFHNNEKKKMPSLVSESEELVLCGHPLQFVDHIFVWIVFYPVSDKFALTGKLIIRTYCPYIELTCS